MINHVNKDGSANNFTIQHDPYMKLSICHLALDTRNISNNKCMKSYNVFFSYESCYVIVRA